MIFEQVTMIDYSRSLKERAEARKVCGPYTWKPTEPGKGRGFYQSSKGLFCDPRGSTFDLRLELANDHPNDCGYGSLSRITGYYCDEFQDETLKPIVARLPHCRGFLAGWTMGRGMCGALDAEIYQTIEDAARAAHSKAEYDAEESVAYEIRERERVEQEERDAEQAEIDEAESVTE